MRRNVLSFTYPCDGVSRLQTFPLYIYIESPFIHSFVRSFIQCVRVDLYQNGRESEGSRRSVHTAPRGKSFFFPNVYDKEHLTEKTLPIQCVPRNAKQLKLKLSPPTNHCTAWVNCFFLSSNVGQKTNHFFHFQWQISFPEVNMTMTVLAKHEKIVLKNEAHILVTPATVRIMREFTVKNGFLFLISLTDLSTRRRCIEGSIFVPGRKSVRIAYKPERRVGI